MGFRFRKSIKIAPGIRVNIGKRGASSVTVGRRGASLSVGKRGTYVNTGIPGTGLSYRAKVGGGAGKDGGQDRPARSTAPPRKASTIIVLLVIAGALVMCGKDKPAASANAEQASTSLAGAPALPWHAIGAFSLGMTEAAAQEQGANNCKPVASGRECVLPNGEAFGVPYSRGHITFSGEPSVATQIRAGVAATDMPAAITHLGQPLVRKGGSRKVLYWNRGDDLVVTRTGETMTVSSAPGIAPQLAPRK